MGIATPVILVMLLIMIAGYLFGLYNRLVFLKNNFMRAWANIDVLLKQRHDEIPKLIKVCEEYRNFERKVLENITSLRSQAINAPSMQARVQSEQKLSGALGNLFAVAENYPELKTNQNFMNLQQRISFLENQLADRREFYNDSATLYNTRIMQVPYNLVAGFSGFTPQELYRVSEEDKKDVEIKFNP